MVKNLLFKKISALCSLALHKVKRHSQMTENYLKFRRFSRIPTPKEKFRCFFGGGDITGENFGVFCSFSPPKQSLKSFLGIWKVKTCVLKEISSVFKNELQIKLQALLATESGSEQLRRRRNCTQCNKKAASIRCCFL